MSGEAILSSQNTVFTCDTRRLRFKRAFSESNLEALLGPTSSLSDDEEKDTIKEHIFGKYFPIYSQKAGFRTDSIKSISTAADTTVKNVLAAALSVSSDSIELDDDSPSSGSMKDKMKEVEVEETSTGTREVAIQAAPEFETQCSRISTETPLSIWGVSEITWNTWNIEVPEIVELPPGFDETPYVICPPEIKYEPVKIDTVAAQNPVADEDRTTVMIRNIPCRYTQDELLEEVNKFNWPVNFLYLPPARHSVGNLGYAFVNFVHAKHAAEFIDIFTDHTWFFQPKSKKRGTPSYATLQGFLPNVDYYSKMKIAKSKKRPYINYDYGGLELVH
jgi:hypothetical protein